MLPKRLRLRDRRLLQTTIRRGTRAGRRYLVVHYLPPQVEFPTPSQPKVAFAVNKAVGGSVVRHRVTRRLRHVVSAELDQLSVGGSLVIRALPPAAKATSAEFTAELDALIPRVVCG